jgi:hypothetical protein
MLGQMLGRHKKGVVDEYYLLKVTILLLFFWFFAFSSLGVAGATVPYDQIRHASLALEVRSCRRSYRLKKMTDDMRWRAPLQPRGSTRSSNSPRHVRKIKGVAPVLFLGRYRTAAAGKMRLRILTGRSWHACTQNRCASRVFISKLDTGETKRKRNGHQL